MASRTCANRQKHAALSVVAVVLHPGRGHEQRVSDLSRLPRRRHRVSASSYTPTPQLRQTAPFSPQKVRKTSVNRHVLPTVEMGKRAGQDSMPTLVNGCHLCGGSSG
jgi:hypothetical protein